MNDMRQPQSAWNVAQARELYNTARWGNGYFEIDDAGRVRAQSPRHPDRPGVDLSALAEELRSQGYALPVLARFSHILHDRVDTLCNAFATAITELDYQGRYTAIYPIKVNQQRQVIGEIIGHGGSRVGLEAGSKPELMAVLALSPPHGPANAMVVKPRPAMAAAVNSFLRKVFIFKFLSGCGGFGDY